MSRPIAIPSLPMTGTLLAVLCLVSPAASAQSERAGAPPALLPATSISKLSGQAALPAQDDVASPWRPAQISSQRARTKPGASSDIVRSALLAERERFQYEELSDGSISVRGTSYKASFTPEGAIYVPFLGSRAPRNFPVSFRLASVSVGGNPIAFGAAVRPRRAGDTISFARGGVTELYQLAPRSMEQKLVFESLPAAGELIVRFAVETELTFRETSAGFEFENALGSVRYGRATAIDALGAATPAETVFSAAEIEIRVPESFIVGARFPLTIDPLVSTFTPLPGSGPDDESSPSIAYDETTNRYCVVSEDAFSAIDHRVTWRIIDSTGSSFLFAGFIALPGTYWAHPAVANVNNANQFLIVAEVGLPSGGARTIHGKTLNAATGSLGADILISAADQSGEKVHPDVGGDPAGISHDRYMVVWQRNYSATDHDIHGRLVDTSSALVGTGTMLIDDSGGTLDELPSISKTNGGSLWHIVWQREMTATNHDIYGAQIAWNGANGSASVAIDASVSDDTNPSASTILDPLVYASPFPWLAVFERKFVTEKDIVGHVMGDLVPGPAINLTGLEAALTSGDQSQNQTHPCAESDGRSFVVAWSESFNGSTLDYDVYVSTYTLIGPSLYVSEAAVNLAFDGSHEDHPDLASTWGAGGAPRRCCAVWDDATVGTNLGEIEAALYNAGQFTSFCFPGVDAPACPCGNPPVATGFGCNNSAGTGGARLTGSGTASITADTMVMTSTGELATSLSTFAQGTFFSGVTLGQGVRCVTNVKRLYTKTASAGIASAPTGGDPSVSARSAALGDPLSAGSTRYLFVYYRTPIVLGGCSPASTFNASQSLQTIWAP